MTTKDVGREGEREKDREKTKSKNERKLHQCCRRRRCHIIIITGTITLLEGFILAPVATNQATFVCVLYDC